MSEESLQKGRVLVVEDENDLSSSLAYALRANGYEALVADRGEMALSALDDFWPDLVLPDIMLPDMSGLEICRRLRSLEDRPQPAVIILSARAQEFDRVVGFEIGAEDYVVKPFSVRELMLRIVALSRSPSATRLARATASAFSPNAATSNERFSPANTISACIRAGAGGFSATRWPCKTANPWAKAPAWRAIPTPPRVRNPGARHA